MDVYAEKVGDNFTKLKIKQTRGELTLTHEYLDREAQHIYDVITGKCGVIEFRVGNEDNPYAPPRKTVYASRLHRKEQLSYIIEPQQQT